MTQNSRNENSNENTSANNDTAISRTTQHSEEIKPELAGEQPANTDTEQAILLPEEEDGLENEAFDAEDLAAFEDEDAEDADESDEDEDEEGDEDDDEEYVLEYDIDDEEDEDEEEDDDENDSLPAVAFEGMDSEEKARLIASAADAVRAEDIVLLDLRELTIITDYFLICTGKSSIQMRAIADRIEDRLRDAGIRKQRVEGYQEATWVLMDYSDVVVHIMAAEQREFYRLEDLWSQAPRVELELLPG